MTTLDVVLASSSYKVIIEPDGLKDLGQRVRAVAPHRRAMLVLDSNVTEPWGETAASSLRSAGYEVNIHELVATEEHKSLQTVAQVYEAMLAGHLERNSPVIALGGGIIGDVAGFAAATYLRGVPVIQAPTTMLAMVDAAIGGKTGVNIELPSGRLGKNIVGAFWQPALVLTDPRALSTLDGRFFRAGLAETVKHAIIADASLLQFLLDNLDQIMARHPETLSELITRSVQVKISIVQQDERESGCRMLLNLGHTFAHAIELIETLDLQHGEAVAIGINAAMFAAEETGRMSHKDAETVRQLLTAMNLPLRLPESVAVHDLSEAMTFDKKVQDGQVRLVLPTGIGSAAVVEDVPMLLIESAWMHVGAELQAGTTA